MSQVQEILDKYLERQFEGNKEKEYGNRRPDPNIPKEMVDPERVNSDDWIPWRAIDSTVTNEKLTHIEARIGYQFPPAYKELLQWKHFYEIRLEDQAISLLPHVLYRWEDELLSANNIDGLTSHLLRQGLWYFADFNDYALLLLYCIADGMEEYGSVLYIEHETPNEYHLYAKNLEDLLTHDSEYSNRFIEKLNEWNEKTNSQQGL